MSSPHRFDAIAAWVWTPETNKWTNPKNTVKETPQEQLRYAMEFYTAKDHKEAIQEFRKLLKHYPRSREAPEAQYHIGLCLEDQGDFYAAFKEYQIVIDKYPFSELSPEIVKRQYDLGVKMLNGSRSGFLQSLTGSETNVIDVFRAVIKNAPYGEWAAPAQYKIGLYLKEKGMYQEARDEFEKVVNDYPESEWVKAAKYQIALSDSSRSTDPAYDQQVTQEAIEGFKQFVVTYPDAELTDQAKDQIYKLKEKESKNNFIVAEFYEKQKNFKAAKIYYQVVVDDFPNSSWAAKALNKVREMNRKLKP